MEIISCGNQSVISGLRVVSLEIGIVLKLSEDSQFRLDQHRPPWQKGVRCMMQGETWLFLGALPSFELFKNMSFCKICETFLVSESVNFKHILSSLANVNMSHYFLFFSCLWNFSLIHFQKGILKPYEINRLQIEFVLLSHVLWQELIAELSIMRNFAMFLSGVMLVHLCFFKVTWQWSTRGHQWTFPFWFFKVGHILLTHMHRRETWMLCKILVLKINFTCIYSSVIILEESEVEPMSTGRKMSCNCCWRFAL